MDLLDVWEMLIAHMERRFRYAEAVNRATGFLLKYYLQVVPD